MRPFLNSGSMALIAAPAPGGTANGFAIFTLLVLFTAVENGGFEPSPVTVLVTG
jgi:hypothetical protein